MPKILAGIAVIAIIAGGIYFLNREEAPQPTPVTLPITEVEAPPQVVPEAVEAAPDIPEPQAEILETGSDEQQVSLPPLADSDGFTRETLQSLSDDEEFSLWIQTDNLIQKGAAIIDGLARGNMLRKIIPIQPPQAAFKVTVEDDRIFLDESGFERFDTLIDTLTNIPPQAIASAFQALRPLLEESYAGLGNPADKVDNSLIAGIDLALETPEVNGPIALKRESVLYQFADPELESLPALQKQMIRLGPKNRTKLFDYLSSIRITLLNQE